MADESSVRALLVAHAPFTALVPSGRVWDQSIPSSIPSPTPTPYVILTLVDEVPENMLAESPGVSEFRIQLDVYADTTAQVRSVVAAIRGALEDEGSEEFTRAVPTEEPNLKRYAMDWRFWLPR